MPRVKSASFLALMLVLAGCAGPASTLSPASTSAAGPATPLVPEFTADTGALLVRVLDEELSPVADAQVVLSESDASATTNVLGEASFDHLAPGPYSVIVQALGFASAGRRVEVTAGEATTYQATLRKLAFDEPRLEVLQGVGTWTSCSVHQTVYPGDYCSFYTTYAARSDFPFHHHASEPWETIVYDLTSRPTSSFAVYRSYVFLASNSTGGWIKFAQPEDDLPLNYVLPAGNKDPVWGEVPAGPAHYRFIPYGKANPAHPVVATFEQKWEAWATIFYGQPAPFGYSALPDA